MQDPQSTDRDDDLAISVSDDFSSSITTNSDSADLTSQLEELTKIVSPKVSELLSEQALALDAFLGGLDDSDDDDYDYDHLHHRSRAAGGNSNAMRREREPLHSEDQDGMDDEWRRLEGAQNDLRNELALAAGLSAFMLKEDDDDDDYDDYDAADAADISPSKNTRDNNNNMKPYTLADHAKTLGVVRPSSERGLFSRPLLSRHDLLTSDIVTLPDGIHRNCDSATDSHSALQSTPEEGRSRSSNYSNSNNRISREEDAIERIRSYTTEYIEPPKTKTLRKLFAGWNPGPGERRIDDERQEGVNRIADYSSSAATDNDNNDDDSSAEEAEFVDVDGVSHPNTTVPKREPTPLRTVTVRIRPDVMCGSVMGSVTDTVERLGGDTVKRQGGHLRAILPGKQMRVYLPGEREKPRDDGFVREEEPIQRVESNGGSSEGSGDAASIASGIASMLFSSPKQQRSKKGPKYVNLPPYLIDAQLVTKKLGKTCHRLLLVRVYRIQDCVGVDDEEEEEILDVPVPLDGEATDNTTHDLELESERSIRSLREAAALIQRIKAVGGQGFAIQPPSSKQSIDDSDNATVASHSSTKSYLKSFGDVITSPIRYLSSPTPPTYSGQSGRYRGKASASEIMSKELLGKCRSSPSVGMASTSAFNAAKLKSHGVFPSLSREDSPYVKASWVFIRECIKDFDQRCLSYR